MFRPTSLDELFEDILEDIFEGVADIFTDDEE